MMLIRISETSGDNAVSGFLLRCKEGLLETIVQVAWAALQSNGQSQATSCLFQLRKLRHAPVDRVVGRLLVRGGNNTSNGPSSDRRQQLASLDALLSTAIERGWQGEPKLVTTIIVIVVIMIVIIMM